MGELKRELYTWHIGPNQHNKWPDLSGSEPNPVPLIVASQCKDMESSGRIVEGVKDLMVSVRLGRMASTMVGDRQVRVSLLNILYCASLIRSCSRCSSTYHNRLIQCIVQWYTPYKGVDPHFAVYAWVVGLYQGRRCPCMRNRADLMRRTRQTPVLRTVSRHTQETVRMLTASTVCQPSRYMNSTFRCFELLSALDMPGVCA